jgi:hypothetical protein
MLLPLSSCGGGGGGGDHTATAAPAASTPSRPVAQSDLDIANLVYSGTSRTPAGFGTTDAGERSHVTTAHVKNTDIAVAPAPLPQYEMCTDDWNQAFDWSETMAERAESYADLVNTKSDERYFEFDRVRSGTPEFEVRQRVFKCAYVDRSSADLRSPEGSAGKINSQPVTADEVRRLSEYLWQFTSYNNFGHVALRSSGTTAGNALVHTIHVASLVRGGLSASCDRIDVLAWRHTAATDSGQLTLDIELLFSFGARESAGSVVLCTQ